MEAADDEPMTLVEFLAAINNDDPTVLCDGLKRARAQIVAEGTGKGAAAKADGAAAGDAAAAPKPTLLSAYLDSSPGAEELFRIWEGLKPVRAEAVAKARATLRL